MRRLPILCAALALSAGLSAALPAQAAQAADRAAAGEAKLAKALDGRIAGKPVSCISLNLVRSSRVIDGTAIIYEIGNKLYLNRPTGGASSLDDDDVMVTRTTGSQLCDLDTVHMIDRVARFPRGFVNLGKFVPYTKPAKAS